MYSRYWFSKSDKSGRTAALIAPTDSLRHKSMTDLSRNFPYYESMKMERFRIVNGFESFDAALAFDVDSYSLAN